MRPLTWTSARALLACLLLTAATGCPFGELAITESGWIRGTTANGAQQFLGIPYAAPPIGALRWRPPAPVQRWTGVRDATVLPNECAQLPSTNGPGSTAEDCLYLSIYRPATLPPTQKKRLPVLIWIHGGSGLNGSGNQQDASEMAATTNTIVVMVNYRLNVFGFLALPSLTAEVADHSSGNLGLLDQQAAMNWVRRNISAFGGDGRNVTIAGESAGGGAVCAHLASPTAAGLFHKAIIQSGAFDLKLLGGGVGGPCAASTLAAAESAGMTWASSLGCTDSTTQAACLRGKSADALLTASASFTASPNASGAAFPVQVIDAIQSGRWNQVPVVVGTTHDELQTVATAIPGGFPLKPAFYDLFIQVLFGVDAPLVLAQYPAAAYSDPAFAAGALATDTGFSCPTNTLRQLLASRTPTYGYEFSDPDAPPGVMNGMPSGAYHSSELQYLFAYTPFNGPLAPAQKALSQQMIRYWGAFAASGEPEVPGDPAWPRFEAGSGRVLSLRPGGSTVIDDFAEAHHCAFWDALGS